MRKHRRAPSAAVAAVAAGVAGLVLVATGAGLLGAGEGDGSPSSAPRGAGPASELGGGVTTLPPSPAGTVDGRVRGRPVRLDIPALAVSARVVPVATVAGVLTPPDDVRLVGWWEGGAWPGDLRGAVLLTGHTYSRGEGVFDHLGELTNGALVRLATTGGTLAYRVEDVTRYPREAIAALGPGLFGPSLSRRLVLTTCSGYDGEHYRTTTVVRAVPVPDGG